MKILQVSHWYANVGGTEEYLMNLCELLKRAGHKVAVIYGHKDEATQSLPGINDYFIPNITLKLGKDRIALASFMEVIEREKTDIVHFHLVNNPWLVKKISVLLPTIYSIHNHFLTCPSGIRLFRVNDRICEDDVSVKCLFNSWWRHCNTYNPQRIWLSYLRCLRNRTAVHKITRFIAPSRYMASTLIQAGFDRDRIDIAPSLPRLSKEDSRFEISDENIVLFVGRVCYEKGVQALIRASEYINTKHRIIIIGDGWYLDRMRKLALKLGLADRIYFNGWTSKEQLHRVYQEASVVVIPSILPESFGLVGLEAMAHSRPVVAFDSGGISSWLKDGENGFLVKQGDLVSLGKKIDLLLKDRKLAEKMGSRGYQLLMKKYNPKKHLTRLVETYESAIQDFRERSKYRVFSR